MPTYTYKCKCGKQEDYWLPINHEPPECCGPMENVFNPKNIVTKVPLSWTASYQEAVADYKRGCDIDARDAERGI